jgi:tetraacyldisaccharide 4'-kinase
MLYNTGVLRSYSFDFPVICVGNLAVGGTGKTPHTLLAAGMLQKENIAFAILSRGYGRRSKGFRYVELCDTADAAGDEPLLMKRRMPHAIVAVCKNRVAAIRRIKSDYPQVRAIILDDAFQYRKLNAGLNLLLTPYRRLMTHDFLLPIGRLRDLRACRHRAEIVVTTQCPHSMLPFDFSVLQKNLKLYPYQHSYCSAYRYLPPVSLVSGMAADIVDGAKIIALAGIANPDGFAEHLKNAYNVEQTLFFGDHHRFGRHSVQKIEHAMRKHPDSMVITTEKDAMRLLHCGLCVDMLRRIAYLPIEVEFLRNEYVKFHQLILNYVITNKRIGVFC